MLNTCGLSAGSSHRDPVLNRLSVPLAGLKMPFNKTVFRMRPCKLKPTVIARDRTPSIHKGHLASSKGSPSTAVLTSVYDWKILEWAAKHCNQSTNWTWRVLYRAIVPMARQLGFCGLVRPNLISSYYMQGITRIYNNMNPHGH